MGRGKRYFGEATLPEGLLDDRPSFRATRCCTCAAASGADPSPTCRARRGGAHSGHLAVTCARYISQVTAADSTSRVGRGYPAHWEADVVLREGRSAHMRPIMPDDAEALVAFYAEVSDQ